MQLTINEEQRQEIEQGLVLQKKALQKNKKNNEDIGNFTGMQEADRRLHILEGGPGGETGLLEMIYRESKDQGPLFARSDEQPDEAQTAGTQSVDEALDDPNFEPSEPEGAEAEAEDPEDEPEEKGDATSDSHDGTAEATPLTATTPLTAFEEVTPTLIAILGEHGITNTAHLAARIDEVTDFDGIGEVTAKRLQGILADHHPGAEAVQVPCENEDCEEPVAVNVVDGEVTGYQPSCGHHQAWKKVVEAAREALTAAAE